jgi:hypothetical protein
MTTWGPGRALARFVFADPTEPDGAFALWQERFRMHAPHMRAVGKRNALDENDLARGVVIAMRRDGAALVAGRDHQLVVHAAFERAERQSLRDGRHVACTDDYRIFSRYLAKLGDARGKAAWERYKQLGRINRAEADREARREGL